MPRHLDSNSILEDTLAIFLRQTPVPRPLDTYQPEFNIKPDFFVPLPSEPIEKAARVVLRDRAHANFKTVADYRKRLRSFGARRDDWHTCWHGDHIVSVLRIADTKNWIVERDHIDRRDEGQYLGMLLTDMPVMTSGLASARPLAMLFSPTPPPQLGPIGWISFR
jgi:hypothetical protein